MTADLTVGVIAGELRERVELSLRRILSQDVLDRVEVLVVDLNAECGELAAAQHPAVRLLPRPNLRYYCEAQAELVREARAPFIAFVEDHTYVAPGWAAAVLRAFEDESVAAVNYAFTVVGDGFLSWSILMAEYGPWMAPHPGGPVRHASSNNVAYRRETLLRHMSGDAMFETEFLIHRAIQAEGGRICVEPRALVAHESWSGLMEACLANGAQKRVIGARRASTGEWGMLRRVLWAAGMSAAPAVFLWRLAVALRHRPPLWWPLIASLPVLLCIYVCCAWNEALGYLFGAGASRDEFRDRELAVRRGS